MYLTCEELCHLIAQVILSQVTNEIYMRAKLGQRTRYIRRRPSGIRCPGETRTRALLSRTIYIIVRSTRVRAIDRIHTSETLTRM